MIDISSYEFIQYLNSKVIEYLPSYRKKVGDKYNFRCPICADSKKSLTKRRGWYYLKNASYYCFNCSTGMSGINFLKFISGSSYDEIRKEYIRLFIKSGLNSSLSSAIDIPDNEPGIFNLQSIVKPEWKSPLTQKALEYLRKRRVVDAPFKNDPIYSYISQNEKEYILIPWIINGVDSYFQLNDFQKYGSIKYIFPKDKKKTIAGLDNIDMSFPYIICFEGYYDSIFVKNGICLGTKAITDYQLKLIKERFPRHEIVISFDNDLAGFKSICKLLQKNNDFKYFKWYSEMTQQKDINEYVLAKNNVNIFADKKLVENLIIDKLKMKLWLLQTGKWQND